MAYAFDSIMSALGQEEPQQGQQSPLAQQNQGSAQLGLTQEGGFQGGGGSGQQYQGPSQPAQNSTSASNKLVQRNRAKAQSPIDTQALNQNIGNAKGALNQEQQNYLARADDPYEQQAAKISDNVSRYAAGDTGSQPWLDLYTSAPGLVDDISLKTNTEFRDADLLQNDAGIRELYRRGADPEYNIGEAALDSALLRGNQQFQLGRDQALRSYKDLLSTRSGIEQESRDKAQAVRDQAADTYKRDVRGAANTYFGDYQKQLIDAEKARDIELQKLIDQESSQSNLEALADRGLRDLKANPATGADLSKFLGRGDDLSQYYKAASVDDTQWQDFITEQDAAQFNRIMGLLGRGDIYQAGRFAGSNLNNLAQGSFDANAFKADALARANIERQAELDAQAEIERQLQEQAAANEAENERERQAVLEAAKEQAEAVRQAESRDDFDNSAAGQSREYAKGEQETLLQRGKKSAEKAFADAGRTNLVRKWGL